MTRRATLEFTQSFVPRDGLRRDVTDKREALPVQARGHQREQQRTGADQRPHLHARGVGSRHQRRARIGDPGNARFREQAAVTPGEDRREQMRQRIGWRVLVEFAQLQRLQRHAGACRLQEGACAPGVLHHEVIERFDGRQRFGGQHAMRVTARAQRRRDQPESARWHRGRRGGVQPSSGDRPARRRMRVSAISGKPTSALGSSSSTASSSAMPRPSTRAAPAQSQGCSIRR